VTRFLFVAVALAFLHPLSAAQDKSVREQTTLPCKVTEQSIFKEARICGTSREGSLSKSDLTVAGFTVGQSTLEEVGKRFPGTHQFRLTKEMEASTGICVKTKTRGAVVFSSGDLVAPRGLDSIFLARAETFESQGAECLEVASLPRGPSTKSGIRLGMEKGSLLSLLRISEAKGNSFAVDYKTSPDKAPWASGQSKPTGKGWVAMSGAYGEFRNGRLRWIVFYGGVSG
jgi:hypothetical protein